MASFDPWVKSPPFFMPSGHFTMDQMYEFKINVGMTEDEMVGWHHWLDGYEFEQTFEVGNGQGSLVCCSPLGHKESDMTKWLNWTGD